jgi:hypothetical protein
MAPHPIRAVQKLYTLELGENAAAYPPLQAW